MPLFSFRLVAQDGSGHYRQGTTEADSKEDARAFLEGREAEYAAFQSDEIEELSKLSDARSRAHVAIHNQQKPYKLIKLEEVE